MTNTATARGSTSFARPLGPVPAPIAWAIFFAALKRSTGDTYCFRLSNAAISCPAGNRAGFPQRPDHDGSWKKNGVSETAGLAAVPAVAQTTFATLVAFQLAPVLRPVPEVEDFDHLFGGTVHNDVRRADEFAGSFHLSGSAKAREGRQLFNAVDNRLSHISSGGGIVLLNVFSAASSWPDASVVHRIRLTSKTAGRYG